MTQLERLQDYYDRGDESLVLNGYEFEELKTELANNTEISDYYKDEMIYSCRYFGRGFSVDLSDYFPIDPTMGEDPTGE